MLRTAQQKKNMSFTFGDAFILGGLLGIAEEVRRNHQKEYHNVQIKNSILVVIPPTLELKKASLKIEGVHPDDALALLCLIAVDHKELSTQEAFDLLNIWKPNKLLDYFTWFANQFNEGNTFSDITSRTLRWHPNPKVRKQVKTNIRRNKKSEEDPTFGQELFNRALNIQRIRKERLKREQKKKNQVFGLPVNIVSFFAIAFAVLGISYSCSEPKKEYDPLKATKSYIRSKPQSYQISPKENQLIKNINSNQSRGYILRELSGEEFTAWLEPGGRSVTIIPTHNLGYPLDYLHQTTLYSYCNQLSGRGTAPISLKVNNNWVDFKQGKGRASVNYYQANGGLIIESASTGAKLTFPKQSISCY